MDPGDLARRLVLKEIRRGKAKRSARATERADEPLLARLQRLLAPTMAAATSWPDLDARLARQGYALKPAGGGLTLHNAEGRRLCKSSELGFAYGRFVERFGAPMLGHPHRMAHLSTKRVAGPKSDDPALFEDVDGT